MIERHLLGEITIKIDGFDLSDMSDKLTHACKVLSIYTKSESIFITTLGTQEKRVRELCDKNNCICEVVNKKGAVYRLKNYLKRYGMIIGALLAAALVFFLSNVVMRVEINGVSDEAVKEEIRGILKEEGLRAGAYIPSLNFIELSNTLFTHSDNVAWASIGASGSVVYVNISTPTNPIEAEKPRIPCNIVSAKDAQIINAEVKVGQLNVLIGDAVQKGQLLVSGLIEHDGGDAKYYHAYANITGRYEEDITFTQPYIEEKNISVDTVYRRALKFFEYEIPLPGEVLKQGASYIKESSETPVKLLGLTLPVSVMTYEFTEQKCDIKTYSTAEAISELYKKLENYEKDILRNVTVIDRNIVENQSPDSVSLTVHYVLEGEIGEISEIYMK